MSASKQRNNASKNDFVSFSQGVSKTMSNADARKLFNDVRAGLGLKETKEFKNHIELESVSETREKFVQGKLFDVGDVVVVKSTNEVTEVTVLGANYVITETNGVKTRRWLDSVEKLEGAQIDEEGGAGDEGTDELRKKYQKDTPNQSVEELSSMKTFKQFKSKTINKTKSTKDSEK